MGIKGLWPFVKKNGKSAIKTREISEYKGKRIAFDGNERLKQYHSKGMGDFDKCKDYSLRLAKWVWSHGITCVFVFDGKAGQEKDQTHEERESTRQGNAGRKRTIDMMLEDAEKVLSSAKEEKSQVASGVVAVQLTDADGGAKEQSHANNDVKWLPEHVFIAKTEADIRALKDKSARLDVASHIFTFEKHALAKFLRDNGVPVIMAPAEADRVLVQLASEGLIDAVAAEDGDFLAAPGVPLLLRGITIGKETLTEYDKAQLMKNLNMTEETFMHFGILCGCDYVKQWKHKVGPATLHKMLTEKKKTARELVYTRDEAYRAKFDKAVMVIGNERASDLVDLNTNHGVKSLKEFDLAKHPEIDDAVSMPLHPLLAEIPVPLQHQHAEAVITT